MNAAAILKLKGNGVVTTTKEKSLLDIAKLLAEHGIGCIVIVRDDDKVAGIVSERDLYAGDRPSRPQGLGEARLALHDQDGGHGAGGRHDRPAHWEMTTHRFRHMPVVERIVGPIGLVSIGDLVKMHIAEVEMEATATAEYTGYVAF